MRAPESKQKHYGSTLPESEDPYLLAIGFFCFYKG